jgi:hypothetical protein
MKKMTRKEWEMSIGYTLKPRILHLTLKRKWYEMILNGIKKEEYRDMSDYWYKRLILNNKKFNYIHFYNGGSPCLKYDNFIIECKNIEVGMARTEWCEGSLGPYFVIELGNIVYNSAIAPQAPIGLSMLREVNNPYNH